MRSALSSLGMMATVLRDASTSRKKEEQPLLRISLPKSMTMPLSAQASGYVDFILPPDKISDELQRLVSTSIK